MKILAAYKHYPATIARYLVEAMRDMGHTVETLGPPFGTYIPWTDGASGVEGMRLPEKYVDNPTYPVPTEVEYDWASLEMLYDVPLGSFDAVFQLTPGWRVAGPVGHSIPHVLVMTDPHVLRWWYDSIRGDFTHVVSMQMHYARPDEYVMPYGYSPRWHYLDHNALFQPEGTNVEWWIPPERTIDVAMIGLQYPNRLLVTDELLANNHNVLARVGLFGDEYRHVYNRAKVGFTWSSRKDTIARVFEVPRMGAALVTNVTPDLPLFFRDGVDFAGFHTAREAIEVCEQLLQDSSLRLTLANNAFRRSLPHSYNQRLATLLESLVHDRCAQAHNQMFLDWLMSL